MATIKNIGIKILKDTSDHKDMPLEVELEYGGIKSIIPKERIRDVLELYLLYDDVSMTPEELIEKVRLMDKVSERPVEDVTSTTRSSTEESSSSSHSDETEHTETREIRTETEDVSDSRIRVTGIGKKLLALLVAGAFLVTGHFVVSSIVKSRDKDTDDDNLDFENNPVIEQTTPVSPVEPVEFGDDVIAPPVSIEGSENLPYINGSTTDWIDMSDAEYLEALNSQTIACQMNMVEISLFLEGEPLEGSKQLTNIQKTFRPGSIEYCIVEYFNQFRNEVVNAAYDTQNIDNTRVVLEHHVAEIYLFATGQRSVALNTEYGVHEYNWNDLSEEAKNAVLDVLFSFAIALPHDYAVNVEGVTIYPVTLAEFYESHLANLTLVNPTNKR